MQESASSVTPVRSFQQTTVITLKTVGSSRASSGQADGQDGLGNAERIAMVRRYPVYNATHLPQRDYSIFSPLIFTFFNLFLPLFSTILATCRLAHKVTDDKTASERSTTEAEAGCCAYPTAEAEREAAAQTATGEQTSVAGQWKSIFTDGSWEKSYKAERKYRDKISCDRNCAGQC